MASCANVGYGTKQANIRTFRNRTTGRITYAVVGPLPRRVLVWAHSGRFVPVPNNRHLRAIYLVDWNRLDACQTWLGAHGYELWHYEEDEEWDGLP